MESWHCISQASDGPKPHYRLINLFLSELCLPLTMTPLPLVLKHPFILGLLPSFSLRLLKQHKISCS